MAKGLTRGGRGRVKAFRLRPAIEQLAAAVAAGVVQPERGELQALRLICRRSGVDFPRELALALARLG